MRDKAKNRDPQKALKRAGADLRCAVRKIVPFLKGQGNVKSAESLEYVADQVSRILKGGDTK